MATFAAQRGDLARRAFENRDEVEEVSDFLTDVVDRYGRR
jgi:hypothetical protein